MSVDLSDYFPALAWQMTFLAICSLMTVVWVFQGIFIQTYSPGAGYSDDVTEGENGYRWGDLSDPYKSRVCL